MWQRTVTRSIIAAHDDSIDYSPHVILVTLLYVILLGLLHCYLTMLGGFDSMMEEDQIFKHSTTRQHAVTNHCLWEVAQLHP